MMQDAHIKLNFELLLQNYHSEEKNKNTLFISKLDLNLREILLNPYIWSTALYDAESWILRRVDQKHLESFEMWCWRRMEKVSWTDHVRNGEVLRRVKTDRNVLHVIKRRKDNWIGHIF
jgi:hypothetical protein